MWAIPGAHQGGVRTHANRTTGRPYLTIPKDCLSADQAPVCVPLRKGGVLLMTNRTPHASFENRTDRARWKLDVRYQSAQLPTNAPITRLQGELVGSEGGDVLPAWYPFEADFLLRSRGRSNEVVTTAAVFHRIRSDHLSRTATPYRKRWTTVVDE